MILTKNTVLVWMIIDKRTFSSTNKIVHNVIESSNSSSYSFLHQTNTKTSYNTRKTIAI
jgi:hypothetical protein